MGLFGTDLEKLVAQRDVPGLWKVFVKKKYRMGGEELCKFADEAWDYVLERWNKKKAKQFDVAEFASVLEKHKKPYAGRTLITPAEFKARMSATGKLAKDSVAKCPGCGEFLSKSAPGSQRGVYVVCKGCRRHYHEGCGRELDRCRICDGWHWTKTRRS